MKDELGGKIMTEFAALRPKTCSYLIDDGSNDKKAKGTKKCVIKRILKFNDYKNCLKIMTQYNSLNIKLSKSQLNKLKSAIKNETEAVLALSSNMIGNPNDETNFLHKLLLTNTQVANLRKALANKSSTDIKLLKTELSKMIQFEEFLARILGPLLKAGLPL